MAVELSSDSQRALYVPGRFAHGYQTLQDGTAILYQASAFYAPSAESGLRYDDPRLAIAWPLPVAAVSGKDSNFGLLENIQGELTSANVSIQARQVRSSHCRQGDRSFITDAEFVKGVSHVDRRYRTQGAGGSK